MIVSSRYGVSRSTRRERLPNTSSKSCVRPSTETSTSDVEERLQPVVHREEPEQVRAPLDRARVAVRRAVDDREPRGRRAGRDCRRSARVGGARRRAHGRALAARSCAWRRCSRETRRRRPRLAGSPRARPARGGATRACGPAVGRAPREGADDDDDALARLAPAAREVDAHVVVAERERPPYGGKSAATWRPGVERSAYASKAAAVAEDEVERAPRVELEEPLVELPHVGLGDRAPARAPRCARAARRRRARCPSRRSARSARSGSSSRRDTRLPAWPIIHSRPPQPRTKGCVFASVFGPHVAVRTWRTKSDDSRCSHAFTSSPRMLPRAGAGSLRTDAEGSPAG